MGKIASFTFITLNGFYKGSNEDTSWHNHSGEAARFASAASQSDSILLFGRKTYEMMSGFWPSATAMEMFPEVAANMNRAEKIVCSNTLKKAGWNNTTLLQGDVTTQLKEIKKRRKKEITVLGSGTLLAQLTDAALVDQYTIMLDPVALGKGSTLFNGIQNRLDLQLISSRTFKKDGILLLTYERK